MGNKVLNNRTLKNKESFIKKLNEKYNNSIKLNSEYTTMTDNMDFECTICNNVWNVKPRTVLDKGCPYCNGSLTRKKTDLEYRQMLKEVHGDNIVNIEPYVGMQTKILHHCNIHNYNFMAKPMKIYHAKQGCHYCGLEKAKLISQSKCFNLEAFKEEVFSESNGEYKCNETNQVNNSTKMSFTHFINGKSHNFVMTQNSYKSGQRCPVCRGLQVVTGYNDLNTTNKQLSKLLLNYEDGYKYTEWSGKKLNWKCRCGEIITKSIKDANKSGLCCPICSDGISYPNKFIYNLLKSLKVNFDEFEREYQPNWCKFEINNEIAIGRYDIYFSYNNQKYIVEMDGGLGHGKKKWNNEEDYSLLRDSEKDRLAYEHNIKMIRIDCFYNGYDNRFEYIKNSLLNSELSVIFNLNSINFNEIDIKSQNSYLRDACELWNNDYTTLEISNELGIHMTTIKNYLSIGAKHNLCDYTPKISRDRSMGHEVICLNDLNKYSSIVNAANHYGLYSSSVSKCCRRDASYAGILNDEKYIFMYLKDYNNISKEDLDNYIPKINSHERKVICLETKQIFDRITDASIWLCGKKKSGIVNCCTGKYSSVTDSNGNKTHWLYYEDYLSKNEKELQDIINFIPKDKSLKVICLTTNKVFEDATKASEFYSFSNKLGIQRCCRGECEYYGTDNDGNKLIWKYYKNYLKEKAIA